MIFIFAGAIALVLVAAFSFGFVIKKIVERRLMQQTGMRTHIESFSTGFLSGEVRIENLVMDNPPGFGDGIFLELPEIYVQCDRDALREGRLHFKTVRIEMRRICVVENAAGKRNIDVLKTKTPKVLPPASTPGSSAPVPSGRFEFDGIDLLQLTLGVAEFSSLQHPGLNVKQDLGIRNETFHDLKTGNDFQTVGAVIMLKSGFNYWLSGGDLKHSKVFLNSDGSEVNKNHSSATNSSATNPLQPQPTP